LIIDDLLRPNKAKSKRFTILWRFHFGRKDYFAGQFGQGTNGTYAQGIPVIREIHATSG
jgi:hypothetical protein